MNHSKCVFGFAEFSHQNDPQNLVSGDKTSQDSSKEPTQLGRDCPLEGTRRVGALLGVAGRLSGTVSEIGRAHV